MTLVTAGKITTLPVDLAGKRRIIVQLDNGSSVMFKFSSVPTLITAQGVVDKYELWKAAEPAQLLAEKTANIRREMAEYGIIEKSVDIKETG